MFDHHNSPLTQKLSRHIRAYVCGTSILQCAKYAQPQAQFLLHFLHFQLGCMPHYVYMDMDYPFDASCHVYKKSSWRLVASFAPLYRIGIFWNYQVYLYVNNNIKDFTYFMDFWSKLHFGNVVNLPSLNCSLTLSPNMPDSISLLLLTKRMCTGRLLNLFLLRCAQ